MNTSERLQTMEALWDSLLYENGEIESPEWHEKILEINYPAASSGVLKAKTERSFRGKPRGIQP